MHFTIRPMLMSDFPLVTDLWKNTEGVGLNEADTEPAIARYLEHNKEMSCVAATDAGTIIGAVLCGHDGRRGYLHHLAVAPDSRRHGVARAMLAHCFKSLAAEKIARCNIFLFTENKAGEQFWRHNAWTGRVDLKVFQKPVL
jgi:putative acetyltransferase